MEPFNAYDLVGKIGGTALALGTLVWVVRMLLDRIDRIQADAERRIAEANSRTESANIRADNATKIGIDIMVKLTDALARIDGGHK
jgi:hypothetical protein